MYIYSKFHLKIYFRQLGTIKISALIQFHAPVENFQQKRKMK
jgi:hypothetical protein